MMQSLPTVSKDQLPRDLRIIQDSLCILITVYLSSKYNPTVSSCLVRIILWTLYTFSEGLFGIGI